MTTYCSFCATKITYSLDKPKSCPSCHKDIASAFKASALSISIPPPAAHAKVESPLYRAKRLVRPNKLIDEDGKPTEVTAQDLYDENEVEDLKEKLLAGIDPDSFIVVERAGKMTLGDIMRNPNMVDQ